jgi:hypothetical protein
VRDISFEQEKLSEQLNIERKYSDGSCSKSKKGSANSEKYKQYHQKYSSSSESDSSVRINTVKSAKIYTAVLAVMKPSA